MNWFRRKANGWSLQRTKITQSQTGENEAPDKAKQSQTGQNEVLNKEKQLQATQNEAPDKAMQSQKDVPNEEKQFQMEQKEDLNKEKKEFKFMAAIDFGTDGTAIAIREITAPDVHMITDWNAASTIEQNDGVGKTKTSLLLDESNKPIAFGNQAWNLTKSGYWLTNLKCLYLVGVYSFFICLFPFFLQMWFSNNPLKNRARRKISSKTRCEKTVTIGERSKRTMKQWAQQANLWSPSIPNQLIIALEPECASIAMMLEMKDKQNKFQTGDCYMLLDLGAGTADMVCHEITGPFEVREMIASFGGPWGSHYIDQDVKTIFNKIFDEERMKKFQTIHPKDYLHLSRNIESSKQRFFKIPKEDGIHRIEIPYEFDLFMQKNIDGNLEDLVAKFEYLEESGFAICLCFILVFWSIHEYDHEYLSLSCKLWKKLFDLRIDEIIKKMDKMLNENEKILNEKLKYVCLVGGFSQSRYLQHKLKQKYESKYKFIIPERPILSVIEGAAQLSRIPSFITSRIVKYTYGVGCSISIEKAQSTESMKIISITTTILVILTTKSMLVIVSVYL
ncbi:hypothetical protein RFI_29027 [Reticulomyxa filosa]|uniref:Uncharacterized protein n=1 Tax=Reticulomyxa filosa TaxID=46433 RepID=X6M4I7_RETFI|nr:hypothetical protein RFI_29027 [Reticulomyxa filosa]|eukprot:ETO08362.1 hypothetical protein RFI_29027 [Reticulomyxa filosa]